MNTSTNQASTASPLEDKVHSLWVVAGMAIAAGSLRFAMWASNWITLWYLYGWATIKRDHLFMLNTKPLKVSNGDVLRGSGPYHYFAGVAIWLPLTIALAFVVDRCLFPERCRSILRDTRPQQGSSSFFVLFYVLPMVFLVTAFLPTAIALPLALVSAAVPILWLRHICSGSSME